MTITGRNQKLNKLTVKVYQQTDREKQWKKNITSKQKLQNDTC